jgi:hypothetical protein
VGRPATSDTVRSVNVSTGDHNGAYLGIDPGALHLVENLSNLFQVGDVSTVRIEGTIPRRTLREGVDEEFMNATGVDLEVEFVRDGVEPALKTEAADQRYVSGWYIGVSTSDLPRDMY